MAYDNPQNVRRPCHTIDQDSEEHNLYVYQSTCNCRVYSFCSHLCRLFQGVQTEVQREFPRVRQPRSFALCWSAIADQERLEHPSICCRNWPQNVCSTVPALKDFQLSRPLTPRRLASGNVWVWRLFPSGLAHQPPDAGYVALYAGYITPRASSIPFSTKNLAHRVKEER